MSIMIRTYSDLTTLNTFVERFNYLKLGGSVGRDTFGFDRDLNQLFYKSREWQDVRERVIIRDEGCDLGIPGYEIEHELLVHHINPIAPEDIKSAEDWIIDPEYLITTTHRTHNAIHYGTDILLPNIVISRSPGDTKLW